MRERISDYIAGQYRKHIKDKVTTVKTALGQKTDVNIAKQLENSKPFNAEDLIGNQPERPKTRIDAQGELLDEDEQDK